MNRIRKIFLSIGICVMFVSVSYAQKNSMVLLETEGFAERGGWVLDQQFMDQMGSPFLMAHGMGKPVADAFVTCTYNLDQHFPTPKNSFFFPGEEFISTMKHYFNDLGTPRRYLRDDQVIPPFRIPYRCLYSINVDNLLYSFTHL